MKKVLLIAALSMASAPAFASKARLDALQSSAHLTDVQNTFEQPWQMMTSGEMATFEFGATSPASGERAAEGGFVRSMGDSYLGLYLGHQPTAISTLWGALTPNKTALATFAINNPMNVWYGAKAGDITWGANLFYASSDVKNGNGVTGLTKQKFSGLGVSGGATNGVWDASLVVGLTGKGNVTASGGNLTVSPTGTATAINGDVEMTSKSNIQLSAGYLMGTLYYNLGYTMAGAKTALGGTDVADIDYSDIKIGVINSHKKDGTDFFYGISYDMSTRKEKISDSKVEASSLPVIIGVEAEAASWLVFRGSLTQNVLLGSKKTTVSGTAGETDTTAQNTVVAAGVGMKWNKFMFDGTFKAANSTTGTFGLDGNNFMGEGSFTYLF